MTQEKLYCANRFEYWVIALPFEAPRLTWSPWSLPKVFTKVQTGPSTRSIHLLWRTHPHSIPEAIKLSRHQKGCQTGNCASLPLVIFRNSRTLREERIRPDLPTLKAPLKKYLPGGTEATIDKAFRAKVTKGPKFISQAPAAESTFLREGWRRLNTCIQGQPFLVVIFTRSTASPKGRNANGCCWTLLFATKFESNQSW